MTDHLYTTSERVKAGVEFDPALLINVKTLYREEYKLGMTAVQTLRKRLQIEIPDSEANFIALHIINAEMNCEMPQIYEITTMMTEIAGYVAQALHTGQDTVAFDRFMTHCRFLIQRIFCNDESESSSLLFDSVLVNMEKSHDAERRCAEQIIRMIENRCHYRINEDEKMYLMIHLIRLNNSRDQNRH